MGNTMINFILLFNHFVLQTSAEHKVTILLYPQIQAEKIEKGTGVSHKGKY